MRCKRLLCLTVFLLSLAFTFVPVAYADADLDVTVPAVTEISLNADGSTGITSDGSSGYYVQNDSLVPVTMNTLTVTKSGSWDLVSWDKDILMDTKEISLKFNGQVLSIGENTLSDTVIEASAKGNLPVEVRRGVWTVAVAEEKAFTFDYTFTLGQKDFILTLDPGEGSMADGAASMVVVKNGETVTLPAAVWSDDAYIFAGWQTDDGVKYAAGDTFTMPIGGAKLTAVWEPGEATLLAGTDFNAVIPSTATAVVFTDETAPSGATLTDVSVEKNQGIVAWLDGKTYYVSTQKSGKKVTANSNCDKMFRNKTSLTSIDFGNLDTSNVKYMSYMFDLCENIKSLDISSFDTSKVQYLSAAFRNCYSLEEVDMGGLDLSSLIGMNHLFQFCRNLKYVDLSGWDTSNVMGMAEIFRDCQSLESLDLSHFDTSKAVQMHGMFYGCYSLKTLDISGFDTSMVEQELNNTSTPGTMAEMFYACYDLREIKLGEKFAFVGTDDCGYLPVPDSAYITGADGKWYNTNFDGFAPDEIPRNAADTYYASLDLVPAKDFTLTLDANGGISPTGSDAAITAQNGESVTLPAAVWSDDSYIFVGWQTADGVKYAAGDAFTMPIGGAKLTAVWEATTMLSGTAFHAIIPSSATRIVFTDEAAPEGATLTDVTVEQNKGIVAWLDGTVFKVSTQKTGKAVKANSDCSGMFSGCSNITVLDLSCLDTSAVTSMTDMFSGCNKLCSVTLGDKFTFVGTDGYLPAPSSAYINGADGFWYDRSGKTYTPSTIPNNTANTYNVGTVFILDTNGGSFPEGTSDVIVTKSGDVIFIADLPVPIWENGDYVFKGWNIAGYTYDPQSNDWIEITNNGVAVTAVAVWEAI